MDDAGLEVDMLSLPDLVKAKKTQRDKDWPMIRRLVEINYLENEAKPSKAQLEFWFQEGRLASMLITLAERYRSEAVNLQMERPLLKHALSANEPALQAALAEEERREREADKIYWLPLKKELEQICWRRLKSDAGT